MKFVTACLFAFVACASAASIPHLQEKIQPQPNSEDNRIVGGFTTPIEKFPYQVTLRYKALLSPQNSFNHRCGGSIHSNITIVTAAHCVFATVASQFQVVAGTNYRRGSDGYIARVQEIIIHENYDPSTTDNDVAILVLGSPLPLNNYTMKAIELADVDPSDGLPSVVTGWGTLRSGGSAPEVLQEVTVPIVSNQICNYDYRGLITDSMLCAGIRGVGGKDACQGDSGGPLVVNGKLAGIVSWGFGCADPSYPGVYAKVSYLLPWINEKLAAINNSFKN